MDLSPRIEQALLAALASAEAPGCPPRLAAAMRHAVFPGGARIRPKLCLAVAMACGDAHPRLADAAAAAIELLHCASLVHDDLPCFDNAAMRRGIPSVQAQFGDRLAVLAGEALSRPSSAAELGLGGAVAHFDRLIARAADAIPRCAGAALLRELVHAEAERLLPQETVRQAAAAAA